MSEPPSVFAELALETGQAVLANSLGRGLDRNKSDERQRPPEAGQGRQSAGSEVTRLWSRSHRPAWNSQAGPGFFFLPRLFMNNGCLAGRGREMPAKPPLALRLANRAMVKFRLRTQPLDFSCAQAGAAHQLPTRLALPVLKLPRLRREMEPLDVCGRGAAVSSSRVISSFH